MHCQPCVPEQIGAPNDDNAGLIETLVLAHPRVRFTVIRPPKMSTGHVATLVTDEPVTSPWEVAAGMVLSSILS